MLRLLTIVLVISLWASVDSEEKPISNSEFFQQLNYISLSESILKHNEMIMRYAERKVNDRDGIDFWNRLGEKVELIKLRLYMSLNNEAELMFVKLVESFSSVTNILWTPVIHYEAFLNGTILRPKMYDENFFTLEIECRHAIENIYKIIDGQLNLINIPPQIDTNLKFYQFVCQTDQSQAIKLKYILEQVKSAASQLYVSLNMSATLANKFHTDKKLSFYVIWHWITKQYRNTVNVLKNAIEHSSRSFWPCHPKNLAMYTRLREQQYYYVNTQLALADFTNHSVITGAKFELINETFYLRIQEGQLLPNGMINLETVRWQNITVDPKTDKKISKDQKNQVQAIDLTEVQIPKNHAITGLQLITNFASTSNERLSLLVYSTKYDFQKGILMGDANRALHPHAPKDASDKLLLKNMRNELLYSKDNQYILIDESKEKSDIEKSDEMGIPLFDVQKVQSSPTTALSGVGLFLRRTPEVGDFIGIRLFNYDYSPHINTNIN